MCCYVSFFQTNLYAAVAFLICFSVFVQASEGATYGLVPLVNPRNIGAVAGIVGAGGNIGAVSWQTMFRQVDSQSDAYLYLSVIIMALSFICFFIPVDNTFMLCRKTRKTENNNDVPMKKRGEGAVNKGYVS